MRPLLHLTHVLEGGGEEHLYAHFPEQRLIIEPTCTTANCLFNSHFWFQVHRLNITSDCLLLLDSHCTYSLKKSLSHYSYQRYWLPVTEVHNVDFTSSSCMIRYSYFHSWCAHVRKKSQIWSAWQMFAKLSVTITLSREFFFFCFFLYEYPELQKTNFVFWSPGYSVCNIDLVCRQPYSWWPPSKAQVQSAWCPLHWDCHEVSARLVFGKAHNLHKCDTWKIMFLNCRKRFDDMIDHLRDLYVHVVVKN